MKPEDIERARKIVAGMGTHISLMLYEQCRTLLPAALDECERLQDFLKGWGPALEEIEKLRAQNALLKSVCEAAEVMTMEGSIDNDGAFSGWCYGMGALQKQLQNWRDVGGG